VNVTPTLLNFIDYQLSRLHVEPEPSFSPGDPQRAQIQTAFTVGRDPEQKQRFEVTLSANIYKGSADENAAYLVEFTIAGQFWSNVLLTPRGVPALIVINALSLLYGAARGIVGQVTAGGVHDRFVLPSLGFDGLVRRGADDPESNIITDQEHNNFVSDGLAAPGSQHDDLIPEKHRGTDSSAIELVSRLHGVLLSIQSFDNMEVRPRIRDDANHTLAEECVIGTYLRTLANIRTIVLLKDAGNFQAIAMIARALFELAVDLRLQRQIPDAADRVMAFAQVEKLRAARKEVEIAASSETEISEVHEKFINDNSAKIEAQRQAFWPNQKRPTHWSGMSVRSQAHLLGSPFDEMYRSHYQELSWYAHAGLTGVANLEASAFPLICGKSYEVAIESYRETLRSVIEQLNLSAVDGDIEKKLELARLLPFTSGPEQAAQLHFELLGK